MKTKTFVKPVLMLSAGSLLLAGCVVREVHYRQAPPPVVVQQPPVVVTPPPPGSAVVEEGQPGTEVVVTEAPPAPIYEVQTVSPGPAFVWVGGAWVWRGHWVWAGGHWARRPRPGAIWIAPHHEYRGGVHVYVRGGWRF